MKVLLQNSVFHPNHVGGAETVVWVLARELSARGLEVDVLASTGRRSGPAGLVERTLPEVRGTIFEAPFHGLYDLLGDDTGAASPLPLKAAHHLLGIHSARWERLAAEALRRSRPDVLHTHTIAGLTPAIWRAARRAGVPIVHTVHDYHLLCARTTLLRSDGALCDLPPLPCRILSRLKLAASGCVSVVTGPSRFVIDRHLRVGAFPAARSEVVRNAHEPAAPQGAAESFARRTSAATPPQGLFLGQLGPHKGVPQLGQALRRLWADDGVELAFAFAGAGPLEPLVAELCAEHPGRCRFHGRVGGAAKEDLLAASDFLVVPSRWHDVAPQVIQEAAARGLPAIGARRGGIPELVRDGETGLVVEPEPEPLAAAIARYARDPDLRRRHGQAARAHAQTLTAAHQAEAFLRIYRELAAGDPG